MMARFSDKQIVLINLMTAAVPEREDEIIAFWERYNPSVEVLTNRDRLQLCADGKIISFDQKTMHVFWLIGMSGWRAIECYAPHIFMSEATKATIANIMQTDTQLDQIEAQYRERFSAARSLCSSEDLNLKHWPTDIPTPKLSRDDFSADQDIVAFDITMLALAFIFLHEFRHVMLDQDSARPEDRREEELMCDVWAREFMVSKMSGYASNNGHEYMDYLRKRSYGFAIASLIIHEATPLIERGGNLQYFSVATRLEAIMKGTKLPETDKFWLFFASLLVGMLRRGGANIDVPSLPPKDLSEWLLNQL